MLATNNLAKAYGARSLFEGATLRCNPGSRYGLVGANGSGKTTFLNILAGDEPASEGNVVMPSGTRLGVLRQDRFMDDDEPILDVAMRGDAAVWGALEEERAIAAGQGDPSRLAELEERVRAFDGYTLEARSSFILEGLGIPVAIQRRALGTLSGGFKLRVLLAQVLVGGSDVLLLDEPTNHLDIVSIRWLEKFLSRHEGTVIVISHDRRFLDNVASHVLDVDWGTITLYTGNYSAFEAQKEAFIEQKEAEIEKTKAVIAHKQEYVDRFRYKASKARQAQSKLKQIEKIEVEELPETSRRSPRFQFVQERPSGRDVLAIEGIHKAYGDNVVLRGVSVSVRRGEKLAVIGPNGIGKSTLLKILVQTLDPDEGEVRWGHEVKVGYFAQDHREILADPEMTALDFLWAAKPKEGTAFVRGHLGRVLFSGEDVHKKIGTLSGGEAARLVFGRLMAEGPNVLVLDEPTNHLDIEAIDALIAALNAYEGTILLVSHDRHFVSSIATRIVEITPQGPNDFPGTYNEYLARCGDDHLDAEVVLQKAKDQKQQGKSGGTDAAQTASWEEQKRRRNRQKELPGKRDKVVAAIEAAEARKKAIHDAYAEDGFFAKTPQAEVDKLVAEEADLGKKIDGWMIEWEAIEAEIASGEGE